MTTGDSTQGQSGGDKLVAQINDITNVIGTLVPTVGAIGNMVRLVVKAVRPSDAQKAQPFQDAIAAFDAQVQKLNDSIAGFEQAKQQAQERQQAGQPQPNALQAAQAAQNGPQRAGQQSAGAVSAQATPQTPAPGDTRSDG